MKKFLTAAWRDLIMINYAVDPALLEPLVPHGVSIDLEDGVCFVSLVGFMFLDTRVAGFLIPFHINFEEVNLRFYVRREMPDGEARRGVVFIKETVPKAAIALMARMLYGEPYERRRMEHVRTGGQVGYSWVLGEKVNRIQIERGSSLGVPAEDSHGSFIIEHYWGYTRRSGRRTDEYRVEHPKWELFTAENTIIDVDFGAVYGGEFAFLTDAEPYSVLLAKGSNVAVYKGERIL